MDHRLDHEFPASFLWGTATASYQIEGAINEDGRGPSVWDVFADRPGAVRDGQSGRFACDHYHLYEQDLDLMARLGVRSYRFSVAWPRIFPSGRGSLNTKGLDFYDRLIDGLLARGIAPALTCFHWDLPQALEDEGGWRVRSTAEAFEEYCRVLARRFGDRVETWFTLNEIPVVWKMGYTEGTHAPGAKEAEKGSRQVCHHLLLGHGLGVRAIREAAPRPVRIGLVHCTHNCIPFFESGEHIAAARAEFARHNGWIMSPVFHGRYPEEEWKRLGADVPDVRDGDLALISAPTDFFGLNVYSAHDVIHAAHGARKVERWYPRTDFSWPIVPDCLYWTIRFTHEVFTPADLYITENGCCYPDQVTAEGRVEDFARIEYLRRHLGSVHRATREGIPVRGYYLWSLLDNFEWAEGYSKRFGIVHVNFETMKRTPKMSAEWYAETIRRGGF